MLKVTDRLTKATAQASVTLNNDQSLPATYTSETRCVGRYESIDSVYDGRFEEGELRLNPVVIKSAEGACSGGQSTSFKIAYSGCGKGGSLSGDFAAIYAAGLPATPAVDAQLQSRCIIKAYSKLQDSSLDVAMMLGEAGETLGMLLQILTARNGIGTFLRDFRKKVEKGGLHTLRAGGKAASDTVLEFYLGISPFLNDIDDIRELFDKGIKKETLTLRRKRGQQKKEEISQGNPILTGARSFGFHYWRSSKLSRKYTATVYYRVKPGWDVYRNVQRWGFSPGQMLGLAWELTRGSFLVDWCIGVGDWLDGISPNPSVDVLGNCVSRKYSGCNTTQVGPAAWFCTLANKLSFSSTHQWNYEYLVRTVNHPFPLLPAVKHDVVKFHRVLIALSLAWKPIDRGLRHADILLKKYYKKNRIKYTE